MITQELIDVEENALKKAEEKAKQKEARRKRYLKNKR